MTAFTSFGIPTFFDTPGDGPVVEMQRQLHHSQAVRTGDRVDVSGQGGWDDDLAFPTDLAAEVDRAFDDVERALATAGATWHDVVSVRSFHVTTGPVTTGDGATGQGVISTDHTDAMVGQLRARLGQRRPIWTQVGVNALGAPGMRVEVAVSAVVAAARG